MQKINGLRSKIDQFNSVQTLLEDAETVYEMFREMGDDEDLLKETAEAADKATEALEKMELETLVHQVETDLEALKQKLRNEDTDQSYFLEVYDALTKGLNDVKGYISGN